MYSAKAFALKKVIRKILVEAFWEYQSKKMQVKESLDITTSDGEVLTDFHQWAAALEHQFRKMNDTHNGIQHQLDIRQSITGTSLSQVADASEENG